MKTLLLTGGTGYIGSHTAVALLEQGYSVIIIDNLSNSSEDVIEKIEQIVTPPVASDIPLFEGEQKKASFEEGGVRRTEGAAAIQFYQGDIRDREVLKKIFTENTIDAVLHFAGAKAVGESCEKPFEYYENNIVGTLHLTEVMEEFGVKNIIFSSSATVYNPSQTPPFSEDTLTGNTTNPYGTTKFLIENILRDLSIHKGFRVGNLRYFNPVGAHSSGLIGEDPSDIPNNLLPYIMKVASGELPELSVFGNDYDTPDGSGVRDYIHVVDLADGHVVTLHWLEKQNKNIFETFNLGTGNGTSVFEMIAYTESIIGKKLLYKVVKRRSGDIASAYCSPEKAAKILNWKAQKTVQEAIADSWNFIQNKK